MKSFDEMISDLKKMASSIEDEAVKSEIEKEIEVLPKDKSQWKIVSAALSEDEFALPYTSDVEYVYEEYAKALARDECKRYSPTEGTIQLRINGKVLQLNNGRFFDVTETEKISGMPSGDRFQIVFVDSQNNENILIDSRKEEQHIGYKCSISKAERVIPHEGEYKEIIHPEKKRDFSWIILGVGDAVHFQRRVDIDNQHDVQYAVEKPRGIFRKKSIDVVSKPGMFFEQNSLDLVADKAQGRSIVEITKKRSNDYVCPDLRGKKKYFEESVVFKNGNRCSATCIEKSKIENEQEQTRTRTIKVNPDGTISKIETVREGDKIVKSNKTSLGNSTREGPVDMQSR